MLWSLPESGYLAVMAYLDRSGTPMARGCVHALAARTTRPVTFGWGPRFLHSTGQYHKGGPQNGVFLQITGALARGSRGAGRAVHAGRLQLAQALGDLGALRGAAGRPSGCTCATAPAGIAQLLAAASTEGVGR